MYASTLQTLPPDALLRRRGRRLADFVGERIVAYRWGRDAIWWALEVLGIGAGDQVLLPASCCDVVLLPFVERGVRIAYYGLDEQLRYSLEEIAAKVNARTRAVYLIHYFGFPQGPAGLRDLCRRLDLRLIEDCAHALLGSHDDIALGEFGDAGIFSLRKMLPVPDGGCLKLNGSRPAPATPRMRDETAALVEAGKLLAYDLGRRGLLPVRHLKTLLGRRNPAGDGTPCWTERPPHDRDMSATSRRILAGLDPDEVAACRRERFAYWLEMLPHAGRLRPLYPKFPAGVVPYSFPVLVEGAERLVAALRARGIYLEPTLNSPWYDVPGLTNPKERFPVVEQIAASLVSLPVHQALPLPLIDRIFAELGKVLCGSGS